MRLETERLILRDFQEDDWSAVLAYQADPRYLRYYAWTERTPQAVRDFLGIFLAQQKEQDRYRFQLAVVLKKSGALIGNCGIRQSQAFSLEADLGYEIAPEQWGQGYATEAARALLRFAFEELKVHRVYAECVSENVGSQRVLRKLGMRQEGHLRENQYYRSRWWDTLIFAILEHEWEAQQP